MMSIKENNIKQIELVCVDDLVAKDHLVRKIQKAIDFSFIYDIVRKYYSQNEGRPSIDPVILFKIIFIKYIFGIKSIRQTIKEIENNIAYRWFLGLSLNDKVPHFTLVNTNYYRRFKNTDVFETIFKHILDIAIEKRFINMKEVYIDSTHVKANANKKKFVKQELKKEKKICEDELFEAINEDRKKHNKKPLKKKENEKYVLKKISKVDPESGFFVKGEKEKCFAYSAHTAVDNKGFVIDVKVTPGNIHDSQGFHLLYDRIMEQHSENINSFVMDVAYKTAVISKKILDDTKLPILPYKRPMTKKGFFKKYEYQYDAEDDLYICPNNKKLKYSTTSREGYKNYKSNPKDCVNCPFLHKCTKSNNHQKVVSRHIWAESLEYAEELRSTQYHKIVYRKRKETVERVFGEGKENNSLRYTRYKGKKKNQDYLTLLFACMNMKKIALWSDKNEKRAKNRLG